MLHVFVVRVRVYINLCMCCARKGENQLKKVYGWNDRVH
jgi:copper chaperone CopZ